MNASSNSENRSPVWWVPTLYFAQGLPNIVVTGVAAVAFLRLGFTPAETAAYTSALYLPWIIKPFWAPVVEKYATRRAWVIAMQALGALLAVPLAFAIPEKPWLAFTLTLLTATGLASATHDTAADGFYIQALSEKRQAAWSGIRNTFFRVANIAGNGGLVWLAGRWEKSWGVAPAWSGVFLLVAAVLGLLALWHAFALPRVEPVVKAPAMRGEFTRAWMSFVERPGIARILAFILLYRFAEGQVQGANKAFFLELRDKGGLGLDTGEVGTLYGTWGVVALMVGGILGGLAIARTGLRRQLWPMAAAMNLPNVLYVWMAWAKPESRVLIGGIIGLEQFGYGFGFAAFMVYLLYVARGAHATAHYAICTGLMACGMALAGAVAAEALSVVNQLPGGGYVEFFTWVMACTLVSFMVLYKLPLEGDFGRRT